MPRSRRGWLVAPAVAVLAAAIIVFGRRGGGGAGHGGSTPTVAPSDAPQGTVLAPSSHETPLVPGPHAEVGAGSSQAATSESNAPRDLRPFLGRILDEAGRPIPHAVATLFEQKVPGWGGGLPPLESPADGSGAFRIDAPELGQSSLATASAPGRATREVTFVQRGEAVELILSEAGVVRVTVRESEASRPVAGAQVRLFHGADAEGTWAYLLEAFPAATGTADARGVAVLRAPLGHARVAVVAPDLAPAVSSIFPIDAKGCDVNVVVRAGATVVGTVRDARGGPVSDVEVVAVLPGLGRRRVRTGADGVYELRGLARPPEDLGERDPPWLEARAFGFATVAIALPELVAGARPRLDVVLPRARVVKVRVVGPDGGPAPGGLHLREVLRHSIRVGDDTWIETEEIDHVLVDGGVVLSDVGPDFAEVRIAQPGGIGEFGRFTIPATGDEWTIQLPARALTKVRVHVESVSGSPVDGADVEFVDADASYGPLARARANSDGVAAVSLAMPRALLVRIRVPNAPPSFQRAFAHGDAPVDVRFVVPSGRIAGRVLDSAGSPSSALVRLGAVVDVGRSPYAEVQTDVEGRFAFAGLAPGEYRLRSTSPDGYVEGTSAQVSPGDEAVLLRLPGAGERASWKPRVQLVDDATGGPVIGNGGETLTLTRVDGVRTIAVEPTVDRTGTGLLISRDAVEPGVWRADVLVAGWAPGRIERLALPMGDEVPVLRLRRGATVRGKFVDTAGRPFHPADVDLVGSHSTWTSSDGEFEVDGVPPGPVELELFSEATGPVRVRATAPASGPFDVVATAARRGSIAIGFEDLPEVSLVLRVVDIGSGAVTRPARRRSESIWVAPGLAVGRYRVECTYDGRDLAPREVDVADGAEREVSFPTR